MATAKQKITPFRSYPNMQPPIVEIEGVSILQMEPNIGSDKEQYNYKESEFILPSVKTLGGYVNGENYWLLLVSDESLLDSCNTFVYSGGTTNTAEIEKATAVYKKNLVVAVLVDSIPVWKALASLLAEKKVFIKQPKGGDLKCSIEKKENDIKPASDILSVLIDLAIETKQGNLPASTPLFKEGQPLYDHEKISELKEKYNVPKPISLLGVYSQVFGVIEVLTDESQLVSRAKQEEIAPGQFFESDETEIVCFPYTGEFPNNLSVVFNATEPAKRNGNKGGYGGNSVTVEGYQASEGKKHFIEFMTDGELDCVLADFDPISRVLVCLSLSGVPAIPNSIGRKQKDTQLSEWRESVSDGLEKIEKIQLGVAESFYKLPPNEQEEIVSEILEHEKEEKNGKETKTTSNKAKAK